MKQELLQLIESLNESQITRTIKQIKYIQKQDMQMQNRQCHIEKERCGGCIFVESQRIGRFDSIGDFNHSCQKYNIGLAINYYDNNMYDVYVKRCEKCKEEKGKEITKNGKVVLADLE